MEELETIIHIILYITIFNAITLLIIITKLSQMAQTDAELLAGLQAANAKVDKIKTEIQALKDAVANSTNVPAEIEAAANQLFTNLQSADDMNPDA